MSYWGQPAATNLPLSVPSSSQQPGNSYPKLSRSRSDAVDLVSSSGSQFLPKAAYATLQRGNLVTVTSGPDYSTAVSRAPSLRREPVESTATEPDLEAYTDRYSGHITSQL